MNLTGAEFEFPQSIKNCFKQIWKEEEVKKLENIVEYHIVYSDIFASTIIIERASSLIIFLLTPTPQFFSYCLSTRTINNKENFDFTQNEVKGKNRKSR